MTTSSPPPARAFPFVPMASTRSKDKPRKTGLTTLPKVFVMSMEKAGLSWGTHFPSGADMMHFATPGQP